MKAHLSLSVLLLSLAWLALPAAFAQAAPVNDNFADRINLSGPLPINTTGSNVDATAEIGEPDHYNAASHSAWWSWTAQHDGAVQIDATGSSSNWVLGVYGNSSSDPDIVVDNADPSGVTVTGAWTTSTAASGYLGSDYLHDGDTGKGTKSVRFTPTIANAGNYDVYLRWTAGSNRATNVPVDVIGAAGTSTFTVNQRNNGGTWVRLNSGPLALSAGTGASVLVRTDGTDGFVVADAVRFVPSPSFSSLHPIGRGGFFGPVVFYAKSGQTYQIAVDTYTYYYSGGSISLNISDSTAPTITSAPYASSTFNESFSYQITASNSPTSYGAYYLPYGLSFDSATGIISGTPLYTGNYAISLYAYGPSSTASGTLYLSVETLAPRITSPTLAAATQGYPFSYQITATKNPTSYSVSGLPVGLILDASTGLISGTLNVYGYFNVYIYATNSHGTSDSVTLGLSVASSVPVVTGGDVSTNKGAAFSYQISATKNPTSYDAAGLPPGLTVDPATGLISGTPTVSGQYDVVLTAQNSFGPGTNLLTLTVDDPVSDNFATRLRLLGSSVLLYATNVDATKETGEPDHAGDPGGSSVWWSWVAPETAQYQIAVVADFDVLFSIYQGSSLQGLKVVTNNKDIGLGRPSTMTFDAIAGRHYQIAVDGASGETGGFSLSIDKIGKNLAKVLSVTTSTGGSVTPGFLGTSFRHLGATYTITATPAPGFLFIGWSGSLYSTSPKLTFSMQEGMTLQADFAPSPFVAAKGTYFGLIRSESGAASSSGVIRFNVDGTGAFTASLIFGGRSYSLRGIFDSQLALGGTAEFSASIPRGSQWPLAIDLILDLSNPGGTLTGTIGDDVVSANINANRRGTSTKENPAPQAGRYTLLGYTSSSDSPQGTGYGVVLVNLNGAVRFAGVLPDGTKATQGAQLSDAGAWPFYLARDAGRGSLSGMVQFETFDYSDLDGTLTWLKPPKPGDPNYPDGFATEIVLSGARYAIPPAGNRVLDFGNEDGSAFVSIDPSEILGPEFSFGVALTTGNRVVADPGQGFGMTIKPANGLFTGHFVDPTSGRTFSFGGAVIQKPASGGGLFKSGGLTSAINFAP